MDKNINKYKDGYKLYELVRKELKTNLNKLFIKMFLKRSVLIFGNKNLCPRLCEDLLCCGGSSSFRGCDELDAAVLDLLHLGYNPDIDFSSNLL